MFELKIKLIKHLQVKGKKFSNEKKLKIIFKNFIKNSKKNYIKSILILTGHFCFIFKTTTSKNRDKPYYFKNSARISCAVKQTLKFILNHKNIQDSLVSNKFENVRIIPQINEKKIFYCYRWSF